MNTATVQYKIARRLHDCKNSRAYRYGNYLHFYNSSKKSDGLTIEYYDLDSRRLSNIVSLDILELYLIFPIYIFLSVSVV